MSYTEKYKIEKKYLPAPSKRRSGDLIAAAVKFVVAHDTGNPGSTAMGNVDYYIRSAGSIYASAHIFVDDKKIVECIPALTTERPEKAWHVRYSRPEDNARFGVEANDTAIAVEYCYGGNINATEAYKRYIWVLAYICYQYSLPPEVSVVGHYLLDPGRRTDPVSGLAASGRTYDTLLRDVVLEYNKFVNESNTMKLIKSNRSNKVFAIGKDNKKYWIFNEETFLVGNQMGMWGSWADIETADDSIYPTGHTIIFVK